MLERILPNMERPSSPRRQVIASVISNILLYGSEVWYPIVRKQAKARNRLITTKRKTQMRVISAYRTVSAEATSVIAGTPPILMLAEGGYRGRQNAHLKKTQIRKDTLQKWQVQ